MSGGRGAVVGGRHRDGGLKDGINGQGWGLRRATPAPRRLAMFGRVLTGT